MTAICVLFGQSDVCTKYGVVALQFLLHSKTGECWSLDTRDDQIKKALSLLMGILVDTHKSVA